MKPASLVWAQESLPLIAAPMLLVSGSDLVIAASRAGAIGSFPTKNCRTVDELERWLARMQEETEGFAPFAPNLIVHKTNTRLDEDTRLVEKYRCAMVITSVGSPAPVMDRLHAAGTLVFADVATPELDGLRMCRAIKGSKRMKHSRVVVTTSVVDSGQVPDEVLQKHQADGYLEKPLDVRRRVSPRELLLAAVAERALRPVGDPAGAGPAPALHRPLPRPSGARRRRQPDRARARPAGGEALPGCRALPAP